MSQFKNSKAGFTLIELLIVVIIVAVLAAVGIPLLQGNVERAKLSEAVAGLGTMRTAVRAQMAELGNGLIPATATDVDDLRNKLGLKVGDLTGRFFEDDDYTYTATSNATVVNGTVTVPPVYCMGVTGDTAAGDQGGATAPKGDQVDTLSRSMDGDGSLYSSADCANATLIG